jgi:DNA-binding transcriptional regulator GbsR (MarR family)
MCLTDIERDFVRLVEDNGLASGLNKLQAKIFAIVYIQPNDISLDEIAEKTGHSLASISLKIKTLEKFGFVVRRSKPKTNKVFFYMPKNLFSILLKQRIENRQKNIYSIKESLPKIIKKYKSEKLDTDVKGQIKILKVYLNEVLKTEKLINNLKTKI